MSDRELRNAALALLVVALVPSGAAGVQVGDTIGVADREGCRTRVGPPGFSDPGDGGYSPCALDRRPAPLDRNPMPPQPRFTRSAHGDLYVLVKPDGSVDAANTRYWALGGGLWSTERGFHAWALQAIRSWRFRPGYRDGKPVRSGVTLVIETGRGPDTLAGELTWRYRHGESKDSLLGTWGEAPSLPVLAEAAQDSIRVGALRAVADSGVFVSRVRYCLLVPPEDQGTVQIHDYPSATRSRTDWLRRKFEMAASAARAEGERGRFEADDRRDCARQPGNLRLLFGRVHRVGEEWAVIHMRGDLLEDRPPGHDWRGWKARCVALREDGAWGRHVVCPIAPDWEVRIAPTW